MLTHESITWSIAGAAVVGAVAVALGCLLRAAGWKNSWIAAGICAGVLCGPMVGAKLFPEFFNNCLDGCVDARDELFRSQRARQALAIAAASTKTVPSDSLALELDAWERSARIRLEHDRFEFDHGAMWAAALLASVVTLARSPLFGRVCWWRSGGLSIGVWTVFIPISCMLLIAQFESGVAVTTWSLIAAAIVAFGAPMPGGRERWTTAGLLQEHAPSLDAARGTSGIISLFVACVAAWGLVFDVAAAWLLPWGTMLAAWGLRDHFNPFLQKCAGPAACAAVAIALTRVDIPPNFRAAPTVGLYFAIEDLRWIAAAIGFSLSLALPWMRSLRVSLAASSAPHPQAALAGVAMLIGVLPLWIGVAIVVVAAASEALSPLRTITATRLERIIHSKTA